MHPELLLLAAFLGSMVGGLAILSIFGQLAKPKIDKDRISALKHHVYQICVYVGDLVRDKKISPQEAEIIIRIAMVAVLRGNKLDEHYLHHVHVMEVMLDERD